MLRTGQTIDRPKDMSKMAKTSSTALALILAMAAAPLMAQTTEEPAKTEEAAPAAPAEDLSLGQEVGGDSGRLLADGGTRLGGRQAGGIAEGEDVGETDVLQAVLVHLDPAGGIGEGALFDEVGGRLRRGDGIGGGPVAGEFQSEAEFNARQTCCTASTMVSSISAR